MGNASSGSDGRLAGDGRAAGVLPPKDGHVLRLWAEVFVAQHCDASSKSNGDLQWVKVTDDIVPVNVTCVEWKPQSTRFRIVAYNSQVDKVCDAYIDQPGHVIEQPAESFLHWISKDTNKHWGLNFTSKEDAARFKAVCTMTAAPAVSKSTSFGTVRSRSKSTARKDPKKSESSPSDIFLTISEGKIGSHAAGAMLTMPRLHRNSPRRLDTRDIFPVSGDAAAASVATDSVFVDVRATPRRPGATSAPVSPTGEFPCLATVTVPGRNGTLCADNLRSILYGSGSLSSPRETSRGRSVTTAHAAATHDRDDNMAGASDCSADDYDCTCSGDDVATAAVDREDDTATIVGVHSTLIADVATPRSSRGSRSDGAVAAIERGPAHTAAAVCLPGSIGPPADEDKPPAVAGRWSLDDSGNTPLLVPVLQSTPLVPGFGSEAGGGDPGISLPARVTPILAGGAVGNAAVAKRLLNPWPAERAARATMVEARRRACSCADSGIGATCSESAGSVRSSARSDVGSCCSNGHVHACSATAALPSGGRKQGSSSASSYSSEGSCRTASTRTAALAAAVAICDSSAVASAQEDVSDGEDSDSCHSMTTVTATSSLLSLNRQACATRKAGWLEMKNWLVRRGRTVQQASRRQWKRYWVSLKGSTLLFYARSGSGGAPLARSSAGAKDAARTRTAQPSLGSNSGSSGGSWSRESRLGAALAAAIAANGEDCVEGCGRTVTLGAADGSGLEGRNVGESEVQATGVEGDGDEGEEEEEEEAEEEEEESLPRHLLHVTDCLVQPIPEHPRRQHVFALSTHHGDAYLLQAPCLFDHDQWIATIHGACAAQYAGQLGRDDTQCVLVGEIKRLQEEIEQDSKMKNMAELQLSTSHDPKTSRAILQQMGLWEKKQEGRYMDQYRFRCYLAALRGDGCGEEQPNPKSLLAAMSQSSKSSLSRLGVLGVTTFHALVCSRRSESYDAVLARCKRRKGGSQRGTGGDVAPRSLSNSRVRGSTSTSSTVTPDGEANSTTCDQVVGIAKSVSSHSGLYRKSRHPSMSASRSAAADRSGNAVQRAFSLKAPSDPPRRGNLKRVDLPNGQAMAVSLKSDTTADELLDYVCSKRQLTTSDCFLCLRPAGSDDFICPRRGDCIGSMELDRIEIRPKVVFQVELSRQDGSCGLQLEAELADGSEQEDELRVFVCNLSPRSAAVEAGLLVGDEILVLNGKMVADLDMNFIENFVASASSLRMTVRSCRLAKPAAGPVTSQLMQHADIYISNMMCPPPPSQDRLPDKFIDNLIVPAPSWVQAEVPASGANDVHPSSATNLSMPLFKHKQQRPASAVEPDNKIKELLQNAEQVTHLCRMANERVLDDPDSSGFFGGGLCAAAGGGSAVLPPFASQSATAAAHLTAAAAAGPSMGAGGGAAAGGAAAAGTLQLQQPLSEAQRLRKVVVELIETERAYVKDLNCLIDRYLEPLKEETFLSSEEVIHLFGNIQEIVHFQHQFLENLESATVGPEFSTASKTGDLKGVLHSIAGSFLYYANHFRLYSSFCASHSRAQKVFTTEENVQLKEFLRARNPKQQHSATLESYLIKPIQRVLKYPLLLAQLKNLSQASSDEQEHLCEALGSMEKVAEHINEMQKIYEEYGHEFDALMHQLNRHAASSRGHRHQAEQQASAAGSTPLAAARAAAASAGASSPSARSDGAAASRVGGSSLHRKVEINVGDLDYYGEAEWLNAGDFVSKPKKGFIHVTTIFVFKNGIVFLCQEKPKPKKKGKGNASVRTSVVDSANSSCIETTIERRFLPVDCVQVRTLPTEHAHVAQWELLLLKSAVEGRAAEKNYVLAHSDVKIRDEFIQSIRTVIRESVDRMSVKGGSRHGIKPRVTSAADFLGPRCPSRTGDITSRYSMNFDLDGTHAVALGDADSVPERSRTIGDLQSVDSSYGTAADRASLSRASVGSTDSTGAKLVYSSQDPLSYSSKCDSLEAVDLEPGSPVWKQRPGPGDGDAVDNPAASGFAFTVSAVQLNGDDIVVGSASTAAAAHLQSMLLPHGRLEGTTEC